MTASIWSLLDCKNVKIKFHNFYFCNGNKQVPFEIVLGYYYQRCERVATYERLLNLLINQVIKHNFNVYNGDLTWTDNIYSLIVYVYCRSNKDVENIFNFWYIIRHNHLIWYNLICDIFWSSHLFAQNHH